MKNQFFKSSRTYSLMMRQLRSLKKSFSLSNSLSSSPMVTLKRFSSKSGSCSLRMVAFFNTFKINNHRIVLTWIVFRLYFNSVFFPVFFPFPQKNNFSTIFAEREALLALTMCLMMSGHTLLTCLHEDNRNQWFSIM